MSLTEKDLKSIEQIVDKRVGKSETYLKDYVGFVVDKSEVKMEEKFDERFDKIEGDILEMKDDINGLKRSIDGLIETDQEFLGILGKHDQRITRLEVKAKLKIA